MIKASFAPALVNEVPAKLTVSEVAGDHHTCVFSWQRKKAKALAYSKVHTGSVTFAQKV
jgi:hypothetical protein